MPRISKSDQILERLRGEGKVRVMNAPEDIEQVEVRDEELRRHRQEFLRKQQESFQTASELVLNS